MVLFGLVVGVVFPFFVMLFGVPGEVALSAPFMASCLAAGALVGVFNHALSKWIVGTRLKVLADGMKHVEHNLELMTYQQDLSQCTPENCALAVDSEDEIGASALAFNHLVSALAGSMRTQAAVRSFSEMLSSHLEIQTLADHALRLLFQHTPAIAGAIYYDADSELKVAASCGLKDPGELVRSDYVSVAMRTGTRQLLTIPEDARIDGLLTAFRPTEVVVVPIVYKHLPLGVVVLGTGGHFDGDFDQRMALFVQGLGLALNNALVHDRLQRLAAVDPLTGVYNRRFGLGRLHEEFGRSVRSQAPLGLLMLDLDHFKAVNDTYGHLVGDRVLKLVCSLTRSCLREGDILLRYGGEEFMVVLPAASSNDIRKAGERIRRSVEDASITDGDRKIAVTVSIGGTACPSGDVDREETMIQKADEALYRAKSSGRNRVEVST
jgi:diguanylate cyclase (GGDEF)-like protein